MTAKNHIQRRESLYSGHVQGVGFRFTTQSVAGRFAVTGFVQNLSDGRVRLVAEGTGAKLDAFQQALAEEMQGNIDQVETQILPALGEYEGFQIRR